MEKQNLTIDYAGNSYIGFGFTALPFGAALQVACRQVDQAADAARLAVLGDPLRAFEYRIAAEEAQAFAVAGYKGAVPATVQAWIDAADLSPQDAADSILAEAAAWKGALYAIRAARLKGKQHALKAGTHEAVEVVTDEAIAAIKAAVQGVGNAA
ncbi:hypothetical protein [Pseudomonas fulva]|uniref:hypothetical protein n=1 Tax=Pseudomonas fulva TaxID=47880 RepID=UPI00346227C2